MWGLLIRALLMWMSRPLDAPLPPLGPPHIVKVRAEAGEVDQADADWWINFQAQPANAQEQEPQGGDEPRPKRRRRRRRRPKKAADTNE